jgi:hypothetical protein
MVIIAYEGKSDGEFFDTLLDEYELDKNQILYYEFKGKDNLFNIKHKHYNEIEKKYLNKVSHILLVVDADNKKDPNPNRGYDTSKKALAKLIEDLSFEDVSMDYYIMCDENKEGYLESFLLSVLDDKQKKCIEKFKGCFEYELTDKWVYNSFYKHNKYPFDFKHPNFKNLKEKLEKMYEEK